MVEYIEDRWPEGPALFAREARERAIQRCMVCEIDQYLAKAGQRFASAAAGEDTFLRPANRKKSAMDG